MKLTNKGVGLILCLDILGLSCDKRKAKTLTGAYGCTVKYSTFTKPSENGQLWTEESWEKAEDVEVTSDKKITHVLNHNVHIDLVRDERQYAEHFNLDQPYLFSSLFKEDSVYASIKYDGGLGGYSARTYTCSKK